MSTKRSRDTVKGVLLGLAAFVIGGSATAFLIGAFDDEPAPRRLTSTTLRSGDREPVVAPPTSRPTSSHLMIDGKRISFPAARLVMLADQPTVELLLYSDEPKDALKPGYGGNRYYLPITLDIAGAEKVSSADFYAKAPTMERADAPDGIFLDGDRVVLQPYEWRVQFSDNGSWLDIVIGGQFLAFGGREDAGPPRTISVSGVFQTELERPDQLRPADRASPRR
jgi:hypothetical protein